MSSDYALEVSGVSKAYFIYERPQDRLKQMLWRGRRKFFDEFWALQGIDFSVRRGETVGIVGRNGSGKSTLLQIVCGTVAPTSGTVKRNGRVSALLELGSGFNPEFTGRENVFLNASVLGLSQLEVERRFDTIAAFADIGDFMDSPVKHYSSGMYARLAFSVAVHVDPEVFIVDEILAVGDAAFQRRCIQKFYEIRDKGCSILFVSHDQYQVKSICQRALYLERGRQRMFDVAARVIDQYSIDIETAASGSEIRSGCIEDSRLDERTDGAADVTFSSGSGSADHESPRPSGSVADEESDALFRITDVRLTNASGAQVTEVCTGETIFLTLDYEAVAEQVPPYISFVFNLYRHDDIYICGTTTLMDGIGPQLSARHGTASVRFDSLPLLSGQYKWRVAINDNMGFIVHAEAKPVCEFRVHDSFQAVGIVSLSRTWRFDHAEHSSA